MDEVENIHNEYKITYDFLSSIVDAEIPQEHSANAELFTGLTPLDQRLKLIYYLLY